MTSDTGVITEEDIRRIVRDEVTKAFAKDPATRKAAIVASKGTLDWAYPPLILASSAAAIGMDASVFFTFYGLNIIHMAAAKMRAKFAKNNVAPIGELLQTAQEAGVRLIACQMTVDVFGYQAGDFIDGVEFAG